MKKQVARTLSLVLMAAILLTGTPQITYAADIETHPKLTMQALPAKAKNKLVSIGKKATSKAVNALAKECGTEDAQKVASFIDTLLKTDKTKSTLKEIDALCNEILAETKQIEADLKDYTSTIERMNANDKVTTASTNLTNQKTNDITNYEKDVLELRNTYQAYLSAATEYAKDGTNQSAVTSAENTFYKKLCEAYGATGASDDIEALAMTHNTVNTKLYNAIYGMANQLVRDGNSDYTYVDRAAQLAYVSMPWSQDQYEMVDAYMSEQVMEITYLLMVYEELLARQGAYIEEHFPDDETYAKNYQVWKSDLDDVNATFVNKVSAMADQTIIASISPSVTLTINQYLRPEDVEGTATLYCDYLADLTYKGIAGKWDDFTNTELKTNSYAVDVDFYMTAKTLAVVKDGGSDISYILTKSFKMSGLDHKNDISGYDQHLPSCDWYNFTQRFWYASTKASAYYNVDTAGDMYKIFDTNAFRLKGSNIRSYLSDYIPSDAGNNLYVLTSDYDVDERSWTHTGYPSFQLINADATQPGSGLATQTFDGEDIQSDGGKYRDYRYMVILTRGSSYKRPIFTEASGGRIEMSTGNDRLKQGESCTIKFKPNSGYEVTKLSIKRHNNASKSDEVSSEEIILDEGDIAGMTADDDGYYELDLYAPYSLSTFSLICTPSTGEEENDITGQTFSAGKGKTAGTYRVLSADRKTAAFVKPDTKKRVVKIPATVKIDDTIYRVTTIENRAFRGDRKLKKLIIGKNVRIIGKKAFLGVKKGAKVVIGTTDKTVYRKVARRVKKIGRLKGATYTFLRL